MRFLERLEPLLWALFSAGGTIAALLLPVHVFLNNIAMPLGWFRPDDYDYTHAARLLGHPLVKAYLAVFLVPTLFHAAHRIKLLPHELVLPPSPGIATPIAYLIAAALAIAAVVVIVLAP
ncbi:MAG: fumarate reductase subunit D [Chloroflexi bacterium]|nr:fumarate reductase subunit D [Chloroflexota bacterium]